MDHSKGVDERQVGGLDVFEQRGLVHHEADTEVRQEQTEDVLPDQIRQLTPQYDPATTQVRLDFTECRFNRPALAVEVSQLQSRSLSRIQDGGEEPVGFTIAIDG